MNFSQFHWYLIAGAVLLLIELVGFTGFLIGIAIAALVTAFVTYIADPVSMMSAALLFGTLSVVLTWVYWRFLRDFNSATDAPGLHQRAAGEIGKVFELTAAVGGVPIAHFVGDTRWQIVSESGASLTAGQTVQVTAVTDAGVLTVATQEPAG